MIRLCGLSVTLSQRFEQQLVDLPQTNIRKINHQMYLSHEIEKVCFLCNSQ
jgi:hypothetical protein